MVDCGKIYEDLLAAGLPVVGVSSPDGVAVVDAYSRALTAPERAQADAIIADPMNLARRPRPLLDIYADVTALTLNQQGKIWQDLSALTDGIRKYYTDAGPNASAITVWDFLIFNSGLATAATNEAKLRLIIAYVQDNPDYLVAPPFDPTINIPGSEPV
jgi:hypothetical protein